MKSVAIARPMLAIVAPMATEMAGVRRAVGHLRGINVMTRVIGVGRERVEPGLTAVAAKSPSAIIMIGFCGGAAPHLRTGDLHLAEIFHAVERPEPITSDPGLTGSIRAWADANGSRWVGGSSVTVGTVANRGAKSALHTAIGTMSVNMEDYWAAKTAAVHGIPFASVRAVLDTADDELPGYLGSSGDGILNVLRGAATHPGSLPNLVRLASATRVARRSLTECVSGLLDGLSAASAGVARLAP